MLRILGLGLLLAGALAAQAGPVDINSADAATISKELNGVGASRARAIVEYREKNGRFATPEDLLKVSGIGPQVLKLNREFIRTGAQPRPSRAAPSAPAEAP
ncbi:MAG: helix-hairpin-helix domain-containing protein [Gammaproteobacteria bacterium PRO9]|nr:helix-hairpin-helix domain-containing protein [Gammaproteobacteria bacterium PRO9]